MTPNYPRSYDYAARIAFVVELAGLLHAYGTTAQRLEAAVVAIANRLDLECEPWANPTGMVVSFSDPHSPPGVSATTRVLRMSPGDVDLYSLCEADHIAEEVAAGRLDLAEGHAALRRLQERRAGRRGTVVQVLATALIAAAMGGLWRLPWLDIAVAASIGLLIGLLDVAMRGRQHVKEAGDAIAGMLAGCVAIGVAAWVAPLNLNTVMIASLVVLLPGMALTNSVNELTSQHLLSGTARFAGAVTTVLKLTVGTMIALILADILGIEPQVRAWRPQPEWLEWVALPVAALAFAALFRAGRRDYPLVMLAAAAGFLISRYAGLAWGVPVGLFLAGLTLTAAGNGYARWANRPGALVRVPGIIMLVPGSASLRGFMTLIQQQDVDVGRQALMAVLNIILALIAGLLFGNLLLPPRNKNL